jgi:starvation-inducible outer membrane lipoprotein
LSYGSINRLPNTDLLPGKIEKVSHEYAILKFFRYVVWEIGKESVLLSTDTADVFGTAKPKNFPTLANGHWEDQKA